MTEKKDHFKFPDYEVQNLIIFFKDLNSNFK